MRLLALPKKALNALEKDGSRVLAQLAQKGEVTARIEGDAVILEGVGGNEWIAEQAAKAIGFGFEPKIAFKLFQDQFFLETVNLEQAFRGDKKKIERYKARVIGQGGRAKKRLAELSGAYIAVSDKEVAIIGEYDEVRRAKEAVLRLLEGAEHTGVYAFLERKRRNTRWL